MGDNKDDKPKRDRPWIFRTYAGHSTAEKSNALYRQNLSKGQTGLSIAFDLPTQTGYDSDHPLAAGEVGKVGVPVSHLGDMRTLLSGIPLAEMNTSMTINAPAAWLLSLYIAIADETGVPRGKLTGTVNEREAKRAIEDVVDQVSGVKDIHNTIRIAREPIARERQPGNGNQPQPKTKA